MAYWQQLLEGHVPVAPVHTLDQALDSPWVDAIGMRQAVDHPDRANLSVLASPIKINGARLPSSAGPLLGADTDAVLTECGFADEEIAELRQDGVV